jgi:hypothetical protein
MFGLILSYFGYAKVPRETVQLIVMTRHMLSSPKPDIKRIVDGLAAVEDLLRSAMKLKR